MYATLEIIFEPKSMKRYSLIYFTKEKIARRSFVLLSFRFTPSSGLGGERLSLTQLGHSWLRSPIGTSANLWTSVSAEFRAFAYPRLIWRRFLVDFEIGRLSDVLESACLRGRG